MLEFAFVLPMIVTLIIGTVELGRALVDYGTLTRVAYETARYAAAQPGLAQGCFDAPVDPTRIIHISVHQKVERLMDRRQFGSSAYTLETSRARNCPVDTAAPTGDNTVRVRIEAQFEPIFTVFPAINMSASAAAAYLHSDIT